MCHSYSNIHKQLQQFNEFESNPQSNLSVSAQDCSGNRLIVLCERGSPLVLFVNQYLPPIVYGDEARNTTQQHVTVHIVMMTYYCANMSTPPVPTFRLRRPVLFVISLIVFSIFSFECSVLNVVS